MNITEEQREFIHPTILKAYEDMYYEGRNSRRTAHDAIIQAETYEACADKLLVAIEKCQK